MSNLLLLESNLNEPLAKDYVSQITRIFSKKAKGLSWYNPIFAHITHLTDDCKIQLRLSDMFFVHSQYQIYVNNSERMIF